MGGPRGLHQLSPGRLARNELSAWHDYLTYFKANYRIIILLLREGPKAQCIVDAERLLGSSGKGAKGCRHVARETGKCPR